MNILTLIQQDVSLTKRGKDWWGLCVFHAEKTPSFSVSPEKEFYHCFSCGAHGDAIDWLRKHRGLTFPEAAAIVGKELPETDRARRTRERSVKDRILTEYWHWYHVQLITWTDRFQDLSAEIETAEIGYLHTVRHPDFYTEAEKEYWAERLATLYYEQVAVEHTCDLLTYECYAQEQFAWWQTERNRKNENECSEEH